MDADFDMEPADNVCALFRFMAHYQQKEFVGQKAIGQDVEEEVAAESCADVLDIIWSKVESWVKREILVNGDNFAFADNEAPVRAEIGNFVILHDKAAKKNYSVSQLSTDVLRKMRDKHINVMVHIYGKGIASKAIHQKMSAALLQPTNRDRAGAHSTASLMEMVQKLKEIHGSYLSGNTSSWSMWANSIHSSPTHRQEALISELPPAHLVHLFRSVPTAEIEVMRSARNGLQVANNLNDLYTENMKIFRQEFMKLKEHTLRGFELFEVRLTATEEMLAAHGRLVGSMDGALNVEVNSVSLQEEQQIPDLEDVDHN